MAILTVMMTTSWKSSDYLGYGEEMYCYFFESGGLFFGFCTRERNGIDLAGMLNGRQAGRQGF